MHEEGRRRGREVGGRTEGCEKLTHGRSSAKRFQSLNQIDIRGVVVPFFFHISCHLFYFVNNLFLWLLFFSFFLLSLDHFFQTFRGGSCSGV